MAEQFNMTQRNIRYVLPGVGAYILGYKDADVPPEVIVEETVPSATFYNISLDGLSTVLDTYTVHLVVTQCTEKHSGIFTLFKSKLAYNKQCQYIF